MRTGIYMGVFVMVSLVACSDAGSVAQGDDDLSGEDVPDELQIDVEPTVGWQKTFRVNISPETQRAADRCELGDLEGENGFMFVLRGSQAEWPQYRKAIASIFVKYADGTNVAQHPLHMQVMDRDSKCLRYSPNGEFRYDSGGGVPISARRDDYIMVTAPGVTAAVEVTVRTEAIGPVLIVPQL